MSKPKHVTINDITDLRIRRSEIEKEIQKLEHKQKANKGLGKNGQFYITACKDQENDGLVFYYFEGNFIAMNSCYDAINSIYVSDLLLSVERFGYSEHPIKIKKISKEEAIKYL